MRLPLLVSPDAALITLFLGIYFIRGFLGGVCRLATLYCQLTWLPVALLAGYVLVHLLATHMAARRPGAQAKASHLWRVKAGMVVMAMLALVVGPTLVNVQARAMTAPYRYAHDGLIQSEVAVRFVVEGKNPYAESYADTAMGQWPFREGDLTVNPALDHYPYLPLTFLLPLPLQRWAESSWGWFDHRIVYLILLGASLAASMSLASSPMRRLLLLLTLGLNPLIALYIVEGRNDILVLFWIVMTLTALRAVGARLSAPLLLSALFLAFACATKQLAWEFVPFWLLYLVGNCRRDAEGQAGRGISPLACSATPLLLFLGAFAALLAPWLLRDAGAFVEDVIAFQSGMSPDGYPIRGVGFSGLLLRAGWVESNTAQFPFWAFQFVFGLPAFALLLVWQARRNTLSRAVLGYSAGLAVILFFSRALNGNYVGYLTAITALGLLVEEPAKRAATGAQPARDTAPARARP